jgi:hypothetical protein
MNIITNNKPYDLRSLDELPAKVQQDFDYVREVQDYTRRFVYYRGAWYDVHDSQYICVMSPGRMGHAMHVNANHKFAAWHAVVSETFFSGVLFKFLPDDRVVCGRYFT